MIGSLIKQEASFLNNTDIEPVIKSIDEDSDILTFTFLIDDDSIIFTHKDTDIFMHEDIEGLVSLPRSLIIKKLYELINSEDKSELDIHTPLSKEVLNEISDTCHNLIEPSILPLIDSNFLLNSFPPSIAYHITKAIVSKLQENNRIIPNQLVYALDYPEDYFNPKNALRQENIDILQDSGAISGK